MNLLIDADACPVVNIAIELANKANIPVTLIVDTSHQMERPGAKTITVSQGNDCADFKLVNMIQPGDVVITQDYGLAAMALAKKAKVINQNGLIYTDSNIDSLLFSRHQSKHIRMAGGRTKGPPKRTHQQDIDFQEAFKLLLE